MAAVKSVYILIHATAEHALSVSRQQVDTLLSKGQPGAARDAVAAVRAFWDEELPAGSKAGALWRELLEAAHALPDPLHGEEALGRYRHGVEQLKDNLATHLRGRL